MNNISADEFHLELARTDDTMLQVIRHAGLGSDPKFDRRLDAHLRSLRALLDGDGIAIALDTIDAAKRVLDAADPAAPLMMLAMARENLAAVVRRQALRSSRDLAA